MIYVSKGNSENIVYNREYFIKLAIDLSNESIANLRRELEEME